jgi:hypothetical protein
MGHQACSVLYKGHHVSGALQFVLSRGFGRGILR